MVICASDFPLAASFFSRYCSSHFTYPSPWKKPDLFIEKVIEEIEKQGIEVLIPAHREGYILAKYKKKLDRYVKFPYPPFPKIVAVNDKKTLIETARHTDIRIPKTIVPSNLDQVEEAGSHVNFPVIIKLRRGHGSIGLSIVKSPSDLVDVYLQTLKKFNLSVEEGPVIQEIIRGRNIEADMLFNHGKPIARCIRYCPRPSFKIGREYPSVTRILSKLGSYLDWHGMLGASLLIEEESELTFLIDVNPRFQGGVNFPIRCGVEYPYLLYQMATGRDVEHVAGCWRGASMRWLWRDLFDSIPKYIRSGDWKNVVEVLTSKTPLELWDWNDMTPFFTLPIYYVSRLINNASMQPLIEKY